VACLEGLDLFSDLDGLAAVLSCVDLVITVDNVTAHLAGALGVPTWTLLSTPADWRWFLDREDSPWYPTMRLFRQESAGGWPGVFERVARELSALQRDLAGGCRRQGPGCAARSA
jgi:ADP-heptose:LPS heptosyltransferase